MIGPALTASSNSEPSTADPELQLCVFSLGRQNYAIDLMRVEEVLHSPELTAVPGAPPFAAGVIQVRGAIVPVVDLRELLSVKALPRPRPKYLLCRIGTRRLGVMVDAVAEVMRVRRSELTPLPSLVSPGEHPYLIGLAGLPDRPALLLELKGLLKQRGGARAEG